MAKRRYNAKKIAQTPSLKKKLAMILAEHEPRDPQISLTNMLAYGHRGLISYSEDDLCKRFDKLFSAQMEALSERKTKLEKEATTSRWGIDGIKREIKGLEDLVARFQEIADEIFEEKVLM